MARTKVQLVSNIVGNVSGGASFTGIVTATSFSGSGANLTGISSVSFATTSFGLSGTPNITVGTVTGNLTGNATGLSGTPNITVGNIVGVALTLSGNLTVNGTQTIINTTSLEVADKNIGIGSTSSPSDALADGSGLTIYGTTNKTFQFQDTGDNLGSSENLNVATGKVYKINNTEVLSSTQVLSKAVPSGTIVGTTDTQTLTNKTLTSVVLGTPSSGTLSGCTGLPLTTGVTGTLPVANGGTGVTAASTGSGGVVLSTSPTLTTPVLGTPSSGTLSSCTVDGTDAVGFRNIPQNSQSAAYTLVLADNGKHIFHPVGDNNARTFTIPANSSVAYPIGTTLTFINMAAAAVTIAITTDTLTLSSAGTAGSRTLAQYGSATCIKITSTSWIISGSGLT